MPAGEYANVLRVSTERIVAGFTYWGEFEWGLDLVLDGIGRADEGT